MKPWIFPTILITFDLLAAVCYGIHGDWRRLCTGRCWRRD